MKRYFIMIAAVVGLAAALGGVALLRHDVARAQQVTPSAVVWEPLPPPPVPPDLVHLEPVEKLGKYMINDTTLSDPPGYACTTCHIMETGFTGPVSVINLAAGQQPGVVPFRFGNRKPQTYGYATFSPEGPYFDTTVGEWIGGNFWDGRVTDTAHQALQPPINPDEMANIPTNGIYPPPNGGYSALLVKKLQNRPYTPLLKQVYGQDVFTRFTTKQIYEIFGQAIAAYEASSEVNPFSSKYDASKYGVPPKNLYTLSASEERGRMLYFGKAQCFQCHSSLNLPSISESAGGKETFGMFCYANIGVPRNPGNPFYQETDCSSNPHGCNPLGTDYIDYGLGANPNPAPDAAHTRFFNKVPGDIPQFRGLFQSVTVRNVDRRPYPTFVKAYMHNGVFKNLQTVVHFYNKRNIAVDPSTGQQVVFDLRKGPPSGYNPLFAPPEVLDNVTNVVGFTPAQAAAKGTTNVTAENGQVGNLQLTASQEADLVNFLKILTDGFTKPNPYNPS